jgi:hypothetical protein
MLNEPCQGSWAAGGSLGFNLRPARPELQDQPCQAERWATASADSFRQDRRGARRMLR